MTKNEKLLNWLNETVALCQPDDVRWCDGSQAENDALCDVLVNAGTFIRLNPENDPAAF